MRTTLQSRVTTTAHQLAHETGFVQRAPKLTGAALVQRVLFGWLNNPQATRQHLAQMAGTVGVVISPQGLDQRFTQTAARFLREVLEAAVTHVVTAHPVAIPLLARLAGVSLLDRSTMVLPDELAQVWRGGGRQEQRTQAALKRQGQFDVSTGALRGPWLQEGRGAAQAAPNQTLFPPGALRLADRGSFRLAVVHELSTAGVSWVSRLHRHTHVLDQTGTCLDVLRWLSKQKGCTHDLPIRLGAQDRLNARCLSVRVPAQVAQQRRRRLRQPARRKGQTPSQRHLALADWTVLVTTVPVDLLSLDEALVLLRARWQGEVLFHRWNSLGRLDASRSAQPWRPWCERYAKMLALLVQHWVLVCSCWPFPDRRLIQAAQTMQRSATSTFARLARAPPLEGSDRQHPAVSPNRLPHDASSQASQYLPAVVRMSLPRFLA